MVMVGHILATLSARIRGILHTGRREDCVPEAESGKRGRYDNVVSYVSASNHICS